MALLTLLKTGQDGNYKNRIFLIYDGIHYDPLSREKVDRPGETVQTTFPMDDELVYAEALSLSKEARQVRHLHLPITMFKRPTHERAP